MCLTSIKQYCCVVAYWVDAKVNSIFHPQSLRRWTFVKIIIISWILLMQVLYNLHIQIQWIFALLYFNRSRHLFDPWEIDKLESYDVFPENSHQGAAQQRATVTPNMKSVSANTPSEGRLRALSRDRQEVAYLVSPLKRYRESGGRVADAHAGNTCEDSEVRNPWCVQPQWKWCSWSNKDDRFLMPLHLHESLLSAEFPSTAVCVWMSDYTCIRSLHVAQHLIDLLTAHCATQTLFWPGSNMHPDRTLYRCEHTQGAMQTEHVEATQLFFH